MALSFSIVVPTLDRKNMLLAALDSARAQQWSEVEIIVVDGGSTDGTIEEIAKFPDVILIEGPDRGIYDAFNKGVARASGDVVGILNSDDVYEQGAFAAVAHAFAQHPNADAVCGTAVLVENDRTIAIYDRDENKLLTPRTALIGACVPNARFFRRASMARVGPFNPDYRYVGDRDWLARWQETGLRTIAIPQRVYRYRQHAGSETFNASRSQELAIRSELLRLAHYWRNNVSASAETKRIAILLQGRCVAKLGIAALREGRMADALRLMFADDGSCSIAPTTAILRSFADWISQTMPWAKNSGKTARNRSY
jgi:glycosyltransferase involved in cell wall biosynthesis